MQVIFTHIIIILFMSTHYLSLNNVCRMKRYTAGSVGDICKILGTRRHMKQYALVEKAHNTKCPVVLSTKIGRLTKHTLKIESVAI